MGATKSTLSESSIKTYMEVTFLTRAEINRVHNIFCGMQRDFDDDSPYGINDDRVKCVTIRELPQLRNNPLANLVMRAFSRDDNVTMTFPEMLDMFSVFGHRSPFHVKCLYAFRIYDVDQDGVLGYDDIYDLTVSLTLGSLNTEEVKLVVEQVFSEADYDNDRKLSYAEFERIVEKSAHFCDLFRLTI